MRFSTRGAALAALAACSLASARARADSPHEFYGLVGGDYYSSPARVLAGVGGGLGYRLHLTEAIALHVEGRYLLFVGNAFAASVGATYAFRVGPWRPAFGLQVVGYAGDQVRVVTPSTPQTPSLFAWSVQARLAPLRFALGAFTASALVVDLGGGLDGGAFATAISFALCEISVRF